MTLEDASQEKALIHQEHTYFIVLSTENVKLHIFQEVWYHKYPEECEG